MKEKIALQLYSLRDVLAEDLDEKLRIVSEQGYDGVELAGTYGIGAGIWKASLDRYGLTAVSAHVGYDSLLEDLEGVLSFYQEIGCRYIILPGLDRRYWHSGEKREEFSREAARIAEVCGEKGMFFGYHNHTGEFEKTGEGFYELDKFFEDNPKLVMELDVGWACAGGVNPADYALEHREQCRLLHMKDYLRDWNGKVVLAPLGKGTVNLEDILEAGRGLGLEWYIVEQDDHYGEDPLKNTEISVQYLRERCR